MIKMTKNKRTNKLPTTIVQNLKFEGNLDREDPSLTISDNSAQIQNDDLTIKGKKIRLVGDVYFDAEGNKKTKMSFNLSKNTINKLTHISDKEDCTMTEALKNAVNLKKLVIDVVESGGTWKYVNKDGKEVEIVFGS